MEGARAAARAVVAMEEAKAGVVTEAAQAEEAGCSGSGNHRSRSPMHSTTKLTLARRRRIRHHPHTAHGHRCLRGPRTCSCSRSRAQVAVARVAVVTAAVTVGVRVGVGARCTDSGSRHNQNRGRTTRLWSRCLHRRRRRQARRRRSSCSTRWAERLHPCPAAQHQRCLLAPAGSAEPAGTVRPVVRSIPRQQHLGCERARRIAGRRRAVAPYSSALAARSRSIPLFALSWRGGTWRQTSTPAIVIRSGRQ